MGHTIRLHRIVKAPPERVYKAFISADALAKWLPPDGFTCHVEHLDAKTGGKFHMFFTNFATGHAHAFGGEFLEMAPAKRLRYTDRFDDPNMPGEITVTVELAPVSCGTDLKITQENVPEMIPAEMCYLGWQDSLRQLMHLVETAPA